MDNKMQDNEIIKALECCIKTESIGDCKKLKCPMYTKNGCAYFLGTDADDEHTICHEQFKYALDLINRQQQEIRQLHVKLDDEEGRMKENNVTVTIEAEQDKKLKNTKSNADVVEILRLYNVLCINAQIAQNRVNAINAALSALNVDERHIIERTLINPSDEAVFELCEELHCEYSTLYRKRAIALNKIKIALYGLEI